jgi:hypothetical protein
MNVGYKIQWCNINDGVWYDWVEVSWCENLADKLVKRLEQDHWNSDIYYRKFRIQLEIVEKCVE